jgi:hypothetical protein
MSEGPKGVPLLMALLPGVEVPIECEANFVSYFDPIITQILWNEVFIAALGYIGVASLKTSHPCGLPL